MLTGDTSYQGQAYANHPSGLLVPEEFKRDREVWTLDELKTIDKATKLLESRGVLVYLGCVDEQCRKAGPLERIRSLDGGITYRCAHRDRVFLKLPRR